MERVWVTVTQSPTWAPALPPWQRTLPWGWRGLCSWKWCPAQGKPTIRRLFKHFNSKAVASLLLRSPGDRARKAGTSLAPRSSL